MKVHGSFPLHTLTSLVLFGLHDEEEGTLGLRPIDVCKVLHVGTRFDNIGCCLEVHKQTRKIGLSFLKFSKTDRLDMVAGSLQVAERCPAAVATFGAKTEGRSVNHIFDPTATKRGESLSKTILIQSNNVHDMSSHVSNNFLLPCNHVEQCKDKECEQCQQDGKKTKSPASSHRLLSLLLFRRAWSSAKSGRDVRA